MIGQVLTYSARLNLGLCVVQAPNVIVPQSFVEEGPILVIDLGKLSFKSGLTGGEKERNKRLAQADSSSSDNRSVSNLSHIVTCCLRTMFSLNEWSYAGSRCQRTTSTTSTTSTSRVCEP